MGQSPVVIAVYATLSAALSGQWIAAKIGLNAAPALEFSTMRFAIGSLVLAAACALTRTPLPFHRWRRVAAAAACGVFGFNTLAFVGLSLTPASDVALVLPTTIPLATALFATLIHERLTSRMVVGFLVASVGAALVIVGGQGTGGEASGTRLVGDLLEIGGATAWGASLTIGATIVRKEGVLGYVTLMALIGTAMLIPLGFLQEGYADVPRWSASTWLAALFLGVFSSALVFVLFLWAVKRFGASLAAMVAYLTPVATLVLAFFILGDRPLPLQLAGGLVILLGVRLAARRRAAARAPTPAPA